MFEGKAGHSWGALLHQGKKPGTWGPGDAEKDRWAAEAGLGFDQALLIMSCLGRSGALDR